MLEISLDCLYKVEGYISEGAHLVKILHIYVQYICAASLQYIVLYTL